MNRPKKMLIMTLVLFAAALLAPAALGEEDHGRWWDNPRIAERLGLSAEQISSIEEIVYSSQERGIELRAEMQRANLTLDRLLHSETADDKALDEAIARMADVRCRVSTEEIRTRYSVARILDSNQRQMLQGLFKQRQRQRRQDRTLGEGLRRERRQRAR